MFTTSRYSSKETRKTAKMLADVFSSKYVCRGKKPLDILVKKARNDGHRRIVIAEEEKGKLIRLRFIEVNADGSWNWLSSVGFNEEQN